MGWVQGGEAVKQLVEFVTFMHRSEKTSSYWRMYQEEVRQAAPKVFVTPAATRWGGYHDAMVRWLELEPLAREWVEKDDRMDQESRQKIAALLPDPEHTDTLKALAYALCVPRLLDLCLQDPSMPTGVMYFRNLDKLLTLLRILSFQTAHQRPDEREAIKKMEA